MKLLNYVLLLLSTSYTLTLKEHYGLQLYLMSDDTLVLQSNSKIFEVDHLHVTCDDEIKGRFKLEEHASILNEHLNFRINLGKTKRNEVSCNVRIGKNTVTITSNAKDEKEIKILESERETYEVEAFDDSNTSDYNWSDEKLLDGESYEDLKEKVNKEVSISTRYKRLLEKSLKHRSVYVTMTTSPERINKIHYVLESLDLTFVTNVLIVLPKLYKNKDKYTIPRKLLEKFPKIQFVSITNDIGPIARYVAAVEYVKQIRPKMFLSDVFISIDDDVAYAESMITTNLYLTLADGGVSLIAHSKLEDCQLPEVFKPEYQIKQKESENKFSYERVVMNSSSIVYRGRLLDVNLAKLLNRKNLSDNPCYYLDDFVLSFIVAYRNTPLTVYNEENCTGETFCFRQIEKFDHFYDKEGKTLRNERTCSNYNRCYEYLVKHFVDFDSSNLEFFQRRQIREKVKEYRKTEL